MDGFSKSSNEHPIAVHHEHWYHAYLFIAVTSFSPLSFQLPFKLSITSPHQILSPQRSAGVGALPFLSLPVCDNQATFSHRRRLICSGLTHKYMRRTPTSNIHACFNIT